MSLKQLTNVLIRVFAREFYRMNSGFFLLTGTLAFGFMSSVEHIALAEFFVSSFPSLTVPLAAWLLYLIKILHFNTNLLHMEDARFVYNVQFLPGSQQIIASGAVLSIQLLPAIVYGVFLILTAWKI